MRKLICLMTVLLLCASLIMPAFAAEEEGFVPSITYKPVPEIVPVQGEDGKDYIGVICNAEGEIIDYVEAGCLRITPVAHLGMKRLKFLKISKNCCALFTRA